MITKALIEQWKAEEEFSFSGWDFSHLNGRMTDEQEQIPWSYKDRIKEFLKKDTKLLDMGTGGGEFLLSLNHPFSLTSVTESWEPNYELCLKKLSPLGITVKKGEDDLPLPFEDESFDLVINRHEFYNIDEVKRVLKKGGHFITQQVGARNGERFTHLFSPDFHREDVKFNLENEVPRFKSAGFKVVYKNQCYPQVKFMDVGAVCYYAKIIPWEFPDFSVEKNLPQLEVLQNEIEKNGCTLLTEHRFIIVAKKL